MARKRVPRLRIVEGVVQARDGAAGIAESGMLGDVFDSLAVDVHLARVAQAGDVTRAVEHRVRGRVQFWMRASCGTVCHGRLPPDSAAMALPAARAPEPILRRTFDQVSG